MSQIKNKINKLFRINSRQHQPDYVMLGTAAVILIFGLIMLSSATSVYSYNKYGDNYYLFKHQLFGVVLGLFCFWFFSFIDYHIWKKSAPALLFMSIALLLLVFIPGLAGGWGTAKSWISVFGFSLQPSEFVKIFFLLYLAAWVDSRERIIQDFKHGTLPFLVVLGVIAVLMLLQPDFGTLAIIIAASMVVYFISGGSLKHIIILILIGAFGIFLMTKLHVHQIDRFRCFIDTSYSTNKECYQLNQALIAIGSGGFQGRGLGQSRQKFLYLPEVGGDAIFPIIAEETGFVFAGGMIALFIVFFYRGYKISLSSLDNYGRIVAIGLSSWIVLQAAINIGGMLSVIPMTGVPLPFVSYGGTSIIATLWALGILTNISKQTK